MLGIWLGLCLSAFLGSKISLASKSGTISNWWTLIPSLGIALCWSLTTRVHKGSLANIALAFDTVSSVLWVFILVANGEKFTLGTGLGLACFVLGLVFLRFA